MIALKSADGTDGKDGLLGAQGITGEAGPTGSPGATGNMGATGIPGGAFPDIVVGSYTIENEIDIARFQGVSELTGNLRIADGLIDVSLPNLVTLGGTLSVGSNGNGPNVTIASIALPALVSAGGLIFGQSSKLASVSLPVLTTVGNFNMDLLPLIELSLPALTSVTGTLTMTQLFDLQSISLPKLTSVGDGGVVLQSLGSLTSLLLPELQTVGDYGFQINGTANPTISLPKLTSISGYFFAIGGTPATTISAPMLTSIHSISIVGNALLVAFDMPALQTADGDFRIYINALLKQCIAEALRAQLTSSPATTDIGQNGGMPNTCN